MSLSVISRISAVTALSAAAAGALWFSTRTPETDATPPLRATLSAPVQAQAQASEEAMREARRKLDDALRKAQFAGAAAQSKPTEADGVSSVAQTPPHALVREETQAMIARAERALQDGDVAAARLLLTRAARDGDARALFLLGESHDPAALAARGLPAHLGDAEAARGHYRQAVAKGYAPARPGLVSAQR